MTQECLFGWPPLPERGAGRPPFIWTQENSNKIKVLLALDWKVERIAHAVGCSAPTLRKVFFRELKRREMARDALKAQMVARTFDLAMAGNVGAMKLAREMLEDEMREREIGRAGRAGAQDEDEDYRAAPAATGKKATAQAVAESLFASDPLLSPRH